MTTKNETAAYLGNEYAWSRAKVRLEDIQALYGGVRLWIPSWGDVFVTKVVPTGKETKFKVPFSNEERRDFYRLCIEQNFVTIQPEARAGLPDEARPSITLTNSKGQQHTISKWVGVQEGRFDVIYHALLDIAKRTEGQKPVPQKLRLWQKMIFWAGIMLLFFIPPLAGYKLAQITLMLWQPDKLIASVGLICLLIITAPLLLLVLRWHERRKAAYDQLFNNLWLLTVLALLFFITQATLPGFLYRAGLGLWADTAVGTVQSRTHRSYLDGEAGLINNYSITYIFQPKVTQVYTRKASVSKTDYDTLNEGAVVTVYYLPGLARFALLEWQVQSEIGDYALILLTAVFAMYGFIGETIVCGRTLSRIYDQRY